MSEEIDRLKSELETEIAARDLAYSEIERLKAIVENQKEALNRWAEAGSNYESLISELADALQEDEDIVEAYCSSKWCKDKFKPLLQRAREARSSGSPLSDASFFWLAL